VPYNPYLSRKYRAHINVEVCASVQAVKYIHKYIYKGGDRATLRVDQADNDEISQYLHGRYVGPSEALWWLFEYPVHEEYPPVIHLPIHLPSQQPVYFDSDISSQELPGCIRVHKLTAYRGGTQTRLLAARAHK
jgi:hypothetical protein